MVASPDPPSSLDLVELSDMAWTTVDPVGMHEEEERRWVELLPRPSAPGSSLGELSSSLATAVASMGPAADSGRLKLVAALMRFLAAHPERRTLDEGLIQAALEEAFAPGPVPSEIGAALKQRADALDAHVRTHAARHPAPHSQRQRPAPELEL